ncbi:hypothetical protein Nepgr_015355 [Nepenthes gracilis]|uniref:Uncharacterized protein n=1 Tax=Nepenthes gracilis TaxID=150966 RepID=A0AAD3XR13_NEPGR|nr:hypothetical protein Nepgr_015355 [Nepenthes gracilis]
MKQMGGESNAKLPCPPPPPPPPSPPKCWAAAKPLLKCTTWSATKQEIENFWKRKRVVEEDHLLAAVKAAARIRAHNLTEDEYRQFEHSIKEEKIKEDYDSSNIDKNDNNKEIRIGIKDWWTKSKYAYLNQPAIDATDIAARRASLYIPYNCLYKPPATPAAFLGVF